MIGVADDDHLLGDRTEDAERLAVPAARAEEEVDLSQVEAERLERPRGRTAGGIRGAAERGSSGPAGEGGASPGGRCASGVSRGLLNRNFSGKSGYYLACVEHAAARVRALEPDPAMSPAEQVRVGLERFFDSLQRHPELHRVLRRVSPADAQASAFVERDREAFTDVVLAGMPGGGGGSALARATARAWLGTVEAAGRDWLEHRDVSSSDLIEVLSQSLATTMLTAARIDPSIVLPVFLQGLDPVDPVPPQAG